MMQAGLALVGSAWAPRARALGPDSELDVAELVFSGSDSAGQRRQTLSRPGAWQRLLYEVIQTTSVECNPSAFQFAPEDPKLFEHPFCVLIGDRALPPMSDGAVEQITRFLSYGGFLLIDDASGTRSGPFEESIRELSARLFPTRPLSPLPRDHSIFRSFFLLDSPVGRVANSPYLEGVEVGPMTPLVFCPNDLSGALERGADGRNRYPVIPGGERQRREAVKLGINLVMYSLTSRYKHDQAHVKRLMEEGRLP
jgi:hypothetical protein